MLVLLVLGVAAVAAANLLTAEHGPWISVYTAFFLIGFDLVARDVLHDRYAGRRRWAVMGAFVTLGGLASYLASPDAGRIALASTAAFAAAFTVDAVTYHAARRLPWLERSNVSNVAGAAVDSVVFVAIAFPSWLGAVAFGQFTAKVAGGAIFALLLERVVAVGVYARR